MRGTLAAARSSRGAERSFKFVTCSNWRTFNQRLRIRSTKLVSPIFYLSFKDTWKRLAHDDLPVNPNKPENKQPDTDIVRYEIATVGGNRLIGQFVR